MKRLKFKILSSLTSIFILNSFILNTFNIKPAYASLNSDNNSCSASSSDSLKSSNSGEPAFSSLNSSENQSSHFDQ
ncbi:MAG: hypothetical protein Q8900_13770, partial [Bacillota bacterium]|nr:hypothetical protein [Bacillota bacterium]